MPSYEQAALEELLLRDELREAQTRTMRSRKAKERKFLGHQMADIDSAIARNNVEPYMERRPKHGQESDEPR